MNKKSNRQIIELENAGPYSKGIVVHNNTITYKVIPSPRVQRIKIEARLIEETYSSFGIRTRVAEINLRKNDTQYCIEIAMGTPVDSILMYEKDIAMVLESPTGKVKFQAPIPGRALIGILVPLKKRPQN